MLRNELIECYRNDIVRATKIIKDLLTRAQKAEQELEEARKTNTRLNRRCQSFESTVLKDEVKRIYKDVSDMYIWMVRHDAEHISTLNASLSKAEKMLKHNLNWWAGLAVANLPDNFESTIQGYAREREKLVKDTLAQIKRV